MLLPSCTDSDRRRASACARLAGNNSNASACKSFTMVYSFTPEELSKYDGVKDKKIYFSVRGTVYDVSKAPDFYGPGRPIAATNFTGIHLVTSLRAVLDADCPLMAKTRS